MTFIKNRLPCPDTDNCGSSDAYYIDSEGKGYCFSCGKSFVNKAVDKTEEDTTVLPVKLLDLELGGYHSAVNYAGDPIADRGLSKESCEFFDIKLKGDPTKGIEKIILPYKDAEGKLCAQKVRTPMRPKGSWLGEPSKAVLFGMDKWSSGDKITIVEGELKCPAFRDLMGDYPVVGIPNGAQAASRDIKKNFDFFKNFNKVYVCFDNDEAGRKAAEEVADLFPLGKAKIVNLRHANDPDDYIKLGLKKEFSACWWNAKDYTPAGIEAACAGGFDSLFEEVDDLELFPYPFNGLNESTFGLRKGEMVTVVAGSGTGKSAFIDEIVFKLLKETDKKIGLFKLEESTKKTKLKLMGIALNKPLHLTLLGKLAKDYVFLEGVLERLFGSKEAFVFDAETKKELFKAWKETIDKRTPDGDPQLWVFNHFGSNSIDTIVSRIDSMVTGLGCEFVFLDHVSIVVSDQQHGDERKALDELATKLRTLVERRNFCLVIVSHLRRPGGKPHEEGGETSLADIRGTAGIGQLSDIVIGLERNGQHESEFLRNVTGMRVLKNRFAGFTGLTSRAHYDKTTGRLSEISEEELQKKIQEYETGALTPEEFKESSDV